MKVLILLTGAPGSGKSYWVQEHGLEKYTISPDELRGMIRNPEMNIYGNMGLSLESDNTVWKYLYGILRERMARGEFTIVDAVFSNPQHIRNIRKLIQDYRYRVYTVSFREVDKNLAISRRPASYKNNIELIYERFKSYPIPNWANPVKYDEFDIDDVLIYKPMILDGKYERIHHIGDIHGCNTVLQKYLDETGGISDKDLYIFVGDYVDRGIENAEVMKFLLSIYKKKNVIMLEGNHERWLWYYASDQEHMIRSKKFLENTKPELDKAGINKKELRQFYRSLAQMVYYKFNGRSVIITHGGIPDIKDKMVLISSDQLINGVGRYNDAGEVALSFEELHADKQVYMIHGHRNIQRYGIAINSRVFNLEGAVEKGGHLRAVVLEDGGFKNYELKNDVYNKNEPYVGGRAVDVEDLINKFRAYDFVREKEFGNISSFNFTRKAFFNKRWNYLTTTARGLFINVDKKKIVARSFNKFFNIEEREETKLRAIPDNFQFPFSVYKKYNGFLGITGYDSERGLILASKTSIGGPYAEMFENMLSDEQKKMLEELMSKEDISLIFEAVDPIRDPHIIKYDKSFVVLIGAVRRSLAGEYITYEELADINNGTFILKEKTEILNNMEELVKWYESFDMSLEEEGFVLEDANQKMIKVKLPYYFFWKQMRGVMAKMSSKGRDNFFHTAKIFDKTGAAFLNYLHDKTPEEIKEMNIISAREEFLNGRRKNLG